MIDFSDLSPQEEQVIIATNKCVIREASADAVIKYRRAILRAGKLQTDPVTGEDKFVTDGGIADAEPVLVAACLFFSEDGTVPRGQGGLPDKSQLVPEEIIRAWPSHVMTRLFNWIKQHSSDLKDTVAEKNGRPTGTSSTTTPSPLEAHSLN